MSAEIGTNVKLRVSAAGLHFFDRRTGLNVLLDAPTTTEWTVDWAPQNVSIALTNACDLACAYCYAPKHPARLGFDEVVRWCRELDSGGCLGIGFGGGEPLLYPRFVELCTQVALSTALAVTFTTHGHWVTKEVAHALEGKVHFIRVSVDGVGSTYERLRGRPYGAVVERLKMISSVAPFGVNYVVNRSTLPDLDIAAATFFSLGASELLLLPEVGVGGRPGIDERTTLSLNEWVSNNWSRYRLSISEAGSDFVTAPQFDPHRGDLPLRRYAHIDAGGVLKRSSYDAAGVSMCSTEGVQDALRCLEITA